MRVQTIQELLFEQIQPNPGNRTEFDAERLKELAASIEAVGVLVPFLVRPIFLANKANKAKEVNTFQLIAGERWILIALKLKRSE